MAASGVRAEKVPAYASYRDIAGGIVKVAGRDRLLGAYFNGGQHLADFVSALRADTLTRVKALAGTNDTAGAVQLLEGVGRTAA